MLKIIGVIEIILIICLFVCSIGLIDDRDTTETKIPYEDVESNDIEKSIEKYIFQFVNEERDKVNREGLVYDAELSKVSKSHATDMAMNNYYSHFDLDGQNPISRAVNAGYDIYTGRCYIGVGENIHCIRTEREIEESEVEELSRRFVNDWVNSFSHYRNIIRPFYHNIGIGVTYDGHGNYYAVQNFR